MTPHQVLNEQPVLQQSRDEGVLLEHARPVEAALLLHRPAQDAEALDEVVGPVVVEPRLRRRCRHERGGLEGEAPTPRPP